MNTLITVKVNKIDYYLYLSTNEFYTIKLHTGAEPEGGEWGTCPFLPPTPPKTSIIYIYAYVK